MKFIHQKGIALKTTPQQILDFWFDADNRKFWFASTPAMDQQILEQFSSTFEAAIEHQLDDWMESPEGALALIIVLDQLPLNMYRDQVKSFSGEQQAVKVCRHALKRFYDEQIDIEHLAFLYMPLMHSESLQDQNDSVLLFEAAELDENARFARHHRDIVQRFGRFPHRNAILGRESSAEELAYLATKEAFTG